MKNTIIQFDDIKTIQARYNNGGYKPVVKGELNLVDDNHIFDENMTVKWNREQVKIHNDKINQLRSDLEKERERLDKLMHEDIVRYIMGTYGFNMQQAKKIESEVYSDKHSCMSDYFYSIDETAELVSEVVKLGDIK